METLITKYEEKLNIANQLYIQMIDNKDNQKIELYKRIKIYRNIIKDLNNIK